MSLLPCSRCGQPIGETESSCAACGQARSAAAPSSGVPPGASELGGGTTSQGGVVKGVLIGATCAFIVFAAWMRMRGRASSPAPSPSAALIPPAAISAPPVVAAPAAPVAIMPPVVPAATSVPVMPAVPVVSTRAVVARAANILPGPQEFNARYLSAAATAQVSVDSPGGPIESEARLAPTPERAQDEYVVYGVVYDLATKAPIKNAMVLTGEKGQAVTNEHGWYRVSIKGGFAERPMSVNVYKRDYKSGALLERNPPLASLSDAERRTIAEDFVPHRKEILFSLGGKVPIVEANFALIPMIWPQGMAPALEHDLEDPPVPDSPGQGMCRYYGVVYDLATLKPLRNVMLAFQAEDLGQQKATDRK